MNDIIFNGPTLHYTYVHISLRNFIFTNTQTFLRIYNAGPDDMHRFLVDFWNHIKKKNPQLKDREIKISDGDFDVSLSLLRNTEKVLLIKLPKPLNPSEAFYIGVIITKNPRYFTLELEKNFSNSNNHDDFIVCEWDKKGIHTNYGSISQMHPSYFTGKIDDIVAP